jgi:hypothetical protein
VIEKSTHHKEQVHIFSLGKYTTPHNFARTRSPSPTWYPSIAGLSPTAAKFPRALPDRSLVRMSCLLCLQLLFQLTSVTMGSTHSVDGKYICSILASAESSWKGCKNDKIIRKIIEVRPMTLGSTHNVDEKYRYSVSGSATFT